MATEKSVIAKTTLLTQEQGILFNLVTNPLSYLNFFLISNLVCYQLFHHIQPFIPQSRFFQPTTHNSTTSTNNDDSDVVPEIVAKLTPLIEETISNSIKGFDPSSGSGQREFAFDLVS